MAENVSPLWHHDCGRIDVRKGFCQIKKKLNKKKIEKVRDLGEK